MSKITLDNLSDNLKAYLEGLGLSEEQVLNLINENGLDEEELKTMLKDTMSINELNTNSKTVIGAINELFQNANNGKELIANAIGEPLDSNDTFSAMSNDINGLLSTFKTNMMNNGITVESNDKFKALIDKIATLADSEGKGVQYASGNGTIDSLPYKSSGYQAYVINTNLDFTPTVLFWTVESLDYKGEYGTKTDWTLYETANSLINVSSSTCLSCSLSDAAYDCNFYLSNVNSESFTLNYNIELVSYSGAWTENVVYHWYAIGVGEEDTTLRDSLANILEEEGVDVTEEDDMASLITKVDEEFNRQVVPAGNAVASNVLSGKTFINSTGSTVTGTMTNRGGAQTVTPGTSNKTLNSGYYSGNITVKGDSNLKAENIKSGVSIFGINGTLSSSLSSTTITKSQVSYKTGYVLVTHNLYVNMSVLFCQVGTYMQSPGTGVIYVSQYTGNAIISNLLNTSESTQFSASFYNDYYSAGDVCTVGLWISDITSTSFRINYNYEYDVSDEETDGLDITVGKIWYM